jgi:1,4-dihydroxy-2-naphthoyl-CoA hydrolase
VADEGYRPGAVSEQPEIGPNAFGDLIGIEGYESGDGWAKARIPVEAKILQPDGIVHGGVYPTLAETVCSAATALAVLDDGMIAMGQANDTSLLRPISAGHVNAHARARHRGRTTWVWDVEITDDEERLCGLVRMTVAVRPAHSRA